MLGGAVSGTALINKCCEMVRPRFYYNARRFQQGIVAVVNAANQAVFMCEHLVLNESGTSEPAQACADGSPQIMWRNGRRETKISSRMGEETFSASKPWARRIASAGVAFTREVPVTGLARTKHPHPHRTGPKALTSRPHRQRCNVRHAALHTLTRGCITRPDEILARFVAYLRFPKRDVR